MTDTDPRLADPESEKLAARFISHPLTPRDARCARAFRLLEKYCGDNTALLRLLIIHSTAVATEALTLLTDNHIASADLAFTAEAALLHDIGVTRCDAPGISCLGTLPYIRHGIAGGEILRTEGMPRHALVCERHTGAGLTRDDIARQHLPLPDADFLPLSIEEKAICLADKFFSKSGDPAKRKPFASVRRSMMRHGEESLRRFDRLAATFPLSADLHDTPEK